MTVSQIDRIGRARAGDRKSHPRWLLVLILFLVSASYARAQDRSTMDIYGFIMLDMGHDFKTIDPDWFDTMRVTKLPSFEGEFGKDHDTFAGIRPADVPGFIVAQLAGAAAATLIFRWLLPQNQNE